jgi:hypothetical protein
MTSYGEDSSDDYEVAADTRDEMRLAGPSSRLDDNDPVYSDIHPDFLNNKQYSPRSPRRNDTIKRRDSLAHTSRNESVSTFTLLPSKFSSPLSHFQMWHLDSVIQI